MYLFKCTPNPSGSGYQWYYYNKRTLAIPCIQHHHLELAHCSGNHFDSLVDAATMRPSTVAPKLAGEQAHHPEMFQSVVQMYHSFVPSSARAWNSIEQQQVWAGSHASSFIKSLLAHWPHILVHSLCTIESYISFYCLRLSDLLINSLFNGFMGAHKD